MKLWLITRDADLDMRGTYDCYHGFVVRAVSEQAAREFAMNAHADEGELVWLTTARCVKLPQAGYPGIILADYHAG